MRSLLSSENQMDTFIQSPRTNRLKDFPYDL